MLFRYNRGLMDNDSPHVRRGSNSIKGLCQKTLKLLKDLHAVLSVAASDYSLSNPFSIWHLILWPGNSTLDRHSPALSLLIGAVSDISARLFWLAQSSQPKLQDLTLIPLVGKDFCLE